MIVPLPLPRIFGWTPKLDTCHVAPPVVAAVLVGAFFVWFFGYDRAPPFLYLGGVIEPPQVREGQAVMRRRLTAWKRADCEIEITGHVTDQGNPPGTLETDRFPVRTSQMADWVRTSREGKPIQFEREMIARMPVHADGTKVFPIGPDGRLAAAQLCYTSVDYATCNWFQRHWPFDRWPGPIVIDGPMMCFKVLPAAPIQGDATPSDGGEGRKG